VGKPESRTRDDLLDGVLFAGRRIGQAAVLFHTKVAAHFGLGPADVKALDLIERQDRLAPSELAQQLGLAPASVTAMIDRLELKGLLRRVAHPTDGRRFFVEFDPSARELMAPLYVGFMTSLNEMYAGYTDKELALIARVFNEAADRQIAAANTI
jgi:DNA-binding MarR family transcriptional regulator